MRFSDENPGGGHLSPLAACHVPMDSLLVLDVARYDYLSFQVDAGLPWAAMATTGSSFGQNRGYILVRLEPRDPSLCRLRTRWRRPWPA